MLKPTKDMRSLSFFICVCFRFFLTGIFLFREENENIEQILSAPFLFDCGQTA